MLALTFAMAVVTGNADRTLPVGRFHAIELATKALVRVEQAPVTSVVVTGDPRLVRCVTADVRDGRLVIGWAGRREASSRPMATGDQIIVTARTDCRHESNPQRLLIRVAAPSIDGVAIREHGIVQVLPMRTPVFAASISGQGSITINGLRATATSLSIPGIGRIAATGELGRLGIAVPGSGVIDTRAAHAVSIDVAAGGHGDIAATVEGPASGTFAGTGTISVGGHPVCAIRKLGRGRIVCPAAPGKDDAL